MNYSCQRKLQLTVRDRIIVEKLVVPHLIQLLPKHYATRTFIPVWIKTCYYPYPKQDETNPKQDINFILIPF
jgi:hypothetical protein